MLSIEETVFLKAVPDPGMLLKFGFSRNNDTFSYEVRFLDEMFLAKIRIVIQDNGKFTVTGKVIDLDNDEEYLPIRNSNIAGGYTSKVKYEYTAILGNIRDKCFKSNYYVSEQANLITRYIESSGKSKIEFPWIKAPDAGIFRCSNQKMFALIMSVDYSKLDPERKDAVEVVNLKVNPRDVPLLTEKDGFYPAYHMNKKHWITIVLDGTVNYDTIRRFTDSSFTLVDKIKKSSFQGEPLNLSNSHWIILCNPHYYDVEKAFREDDQLLWKQTTRIKPGDHAYIYVGAPYSCIMYKCVVDETDIPYEHSGKSVKVKKAMKITRLRKYRTGAISHATLARFGIKLLVGPRRMSEELIQYIEENLEKGL